MERSWRWHLAFCCRVPIGAQVAGAAFARTTALPSEAVIFNAQIWTENPRVLYQVDESSRHGYISASGTAYGI
jgi:hypothetical protein